MAERGGEMIATVRIAPVEQWCENLQRRLEKFPAMAKAVGLSIEIDTNSMRLSAIMHDEPVRWWQATSESDARVCQAAGLEPTPDYHDFCEHMLEMD